MKTMKLGMKALTIFALGLCLAACSKDNEEAGPDYSSGGRDHGQGNEQKQTIDGYEYVDLGLSVKWATCNVGADTGIDAGDFFQYGNTEPNFFVNEYQLPYSDIGGTSLDPVYVNMSEKWRMPTRAEMVELVNGCEWAVATSNNGTRYYVGTSLINAKKIYLPAAGAYPLGSSNNDILYENEQCWLMTSTLNDGGNPRPYILKIQYLSETNNSINVTTNEVGRYSSMPVRGVSTAKPDNAGSDGNDDPNNPISFSDIVGVWQHAEEEESAIMGFNADGSGWVYFENAEEYGIDVTYFSYVYDKEQNIVTFNSPKHIYFGYEEEISFTNHGMILGTQRKGYDEWIPYSGEMPKVVEPDKHMADCLYIDGSEYIDLGLSVNWANKNLGSNNMMGGQNSYYQYGNISPFRNDWTTNDYNLSTYDIGGTYLDPVTQSKGTHWRMPTRDEMQELVDRCTWTIEKGVFYEIRYFKVQGPSGHCIYLPMSGAYPLGLSNNSVLYQNYQCWLLTSTLDESGNPRPYILKATYSDSNSQPQIVVTTNEAQRISGIPIRGVTIANTNNY